MGTKGKSIEKRSEELVSRIESKCTMTSIKGASTAKGKKVIVLSIDLPGEVDMAALWSMVNINTLRLTLEDLQVDAYDALMAGKPRQKPLDPSFLGQALGGPVFREPADDSDAGAEEAEEARLAAVDADEEEARDIEEGARETVDADEEGKTASATSRLSWRQSLAELEPWAPDSAPRGWPYADIFVEKVGDVYLPTVALLDSLEPRWRDILWANKEMAIEELIFILEIEKGLAETGETADPNSEKGLELMFRLDNEARNVPASEGQGTDPDLSDFLKNAQPGETWEEYTRRVSNIREASESEESGYDGPIPPEPTTSGRRGRRSH